MQTTITVDDVLFETASRLVVDADPAVVVGLGLEALVAREVARRCRELGGSDPEASAASRVRSDRA